MRQSEAKLLAVLFFVTAICVGSMIGCEKQPELQSTWRDRGITIDGVGDEWGSATIYDENAKVSLTLFNDDDNLYVLLFTRDRMLQSQVMRMGFTVWFDPDGSDSKVFGLRFPLGMHGMGMPMADRESMRDPEEVQRMIAESVDELEILGPTEEETLIMALIEAESQGISVRLGSSNGNLVYELQVPLYQSDERPHSVGIGQNEIASSKVISIGFETPEIDMEEMRKSMSRRSVGDMPTGNIGIQGGGKRGGGMRGGRPGGGGKKSESLDLWTKITLASATTGD